MSRAGRINVTETQLLHQLALLCLPSCLTALMHLTVYCIIRAFVFLKTGTNHVLKLVCYDPLTAMSHQLKCLH